MYQNLAYPTNVNTRPPIQNSIINAPLCLQNSWRRPSFPYERRHMMSGRYINVGVRPISHRPNTPIPYKYIPGIKYPVPKATGVTNTYIGQRPQFFLGLANAVGNQINQHMIQVSKNNEKQIAGQNSEQCRGLSNSMTNLSSGITPTFIQRPSFNLVPCNMFQSQNNQGVYPFVHNSGCTTASINQINRPNISNTSSGLIFQSQAHGIGLNYYNTNTVESKWNTNVNHCMSESNEVKQTPIPPEIEQYNKYRVDYQNQNMQDPSFNGTFVNALYSKNQSMTAKIIMFPTNICIAPSQNIWNAAPVNISNPPSQSYFLPHADITQQNIVNYNIKPIMPPPVFPNPVVSQNLSSNIIINECNHNVTQNVLSSNNVTQNNSNGNFNLLSLGETDHDAQRHENTLQSSNLINRNQNSIQDCLWTKTNDHNESASQNQFSVNGMIDSSNNNSSAEISSNLDPTANMILIKEIKKEPLFDNKSAENTNANALSSIDSSSIKAEKEISKKNEDKTIRYRNEKFGNIKNIDIQSTKTDDNTFDKINCGSTSNLQKIKQTNKSRPVCSIPVPGTSWCVVWTGEDKVFFFDSQCKLSIWKRPSELLNRNDVDKMLEKNPVSNDSKDISKEVCKTSCYHSDVIQKIGKDDQEVVKTYLNENSQSKITSVGGNSKNISDVCGLSQITDNSKSDTFSQEERIKMFCEMLSEKNVSILSSWEKEINKVIPDPRYMLLTTEERKDVFTDYIKRNLEDEIIKRRRKYQLQKAKFLSLLIEAGITSEFRFTDIAQRFAEDSRFKGFEDMALKESIFNQYVSKLKIDDGEKENNENQRKNELSKFPYTKNCFDNNVGFQNASVNEKCFKFTNNSYVKKNVLKEYSHEKCETIPMAKRQRRLNITLDNKEDEVKGQLSNYQKNNENEIEDQKHKFAIKNFKFLLVDTIKNSDVSWKTAKKILRSDKRWNFSENLDSETCEHLFIEYTSILKYKRIHQLHRFLDISPNATFKQPWLNKPRCAFEDARSNRYFF